MSKKKENIKDAAEERRTRERDLEDKEIEEWLCERY
jgi:hypothetical protein